IGLNLAGVERGIRHNIIGEFDELDIEAILRRDRPHGLKDLGMRPRRDADLDGLRRGTGRPGGEERREDQGKAKRHSWSPWNRQQSVPSSPVGSAKSIKGKFKFGRSARRHFSSDRGTGNESLPMLSVGQTSPMRARNSAPASTSSS